MTQHEQINHGLHQHLTYADHVIMVIQQKLSHSNLSFLNDRSGKKKP